MRRKRSMWARAVLSMTMVTILVGPLAHAEDDPTNLVTIPDPTVFVIQPPSKRPPMPSKPQASFHLSGRCAEETDISTDEYNRQAQAQMINGIILVDDVLPLLDDLTGESFSSFGHSAANAAGGFGGCVNKNEAGGGDPGGGVTVECWAIDKTWTNKNNSGSVAYAFRMQLSWCGDGSKITEITYNNAVHAGGFWYFEGSSTSDTGIGQSTSSINDDWRYTWEEYGANFWRNPRVDATIDAFGRMSGTVYWG